MYPREALVFDVSAFVGVGSGLGLREFVGLDSDGEVQTNCLCCCHLFAYPQHWLSPLTPAARRLLSDLKAGRL